MKPTKSKPFFSRPRDESTEAFKGWINEFFEKLTGRPAEDDITDEEWEKLAQKFWGKAKKKDTPQE